MILACCSLGIVATQLGDQNEPESRSVELPDLATTEPAALASTNTHTPALALLSTVTSTFTPSPTPQVSNSPTPQPDPPTLTPVPEDVQPVLVAAADFAVNLRGGPGVNYSVISTLSPGEELEIVGRNQDSTWWQVTLPDGGLAWAAAEVVSTRDVDETAIPLVEPPATPTAAPQPTPTEAPLPTPTPQPAAPTSAPAQPQPGPACSCSGDAYNCGDFNTHSEAQGCFDYCRSNGTGDIHRLDSDNDGIACESLP